MLRSPSEHVRCESMTEHTIWQLLALKIQASINNNTPDQALAWIEVADRLRRAAPTNEYGRASSLAEHLGLGAPT